VLNALEAVSPPDGEVRVGVEAFGGSVELSVADDGRGMAPNELERIFEPFYSGRHPGPDRIHDGATHPQSSRSGSGLGLSISHAIVTAHGGRIEAYSDGPGKGSRFVVRLPVARDAPDAPDASREVSA